MTNRGSIRYLAAAAAILLSAPTAHSQDLVQLRYEDMRKLTDRLDELQRQVEGIEYQLRNMRDAQNSFFTMVEDGAAGFDGILPPGDDWQSFPHYNGFRCWDVTEGYVYTYRSGVDALSEALEEPSLVCAWVTRWE